MLSSPMLPAPAIRTLNSFQFLDIYVLPALRFPCKGVRVKTFIRCPVF